LNNEYVYKKKMDYKMELVSNRIVQGYIFLWDEANEMFECRGDVMYDNYHDETPEPELWKAALLLEKMLKYEGWNAEANHSEKGWVEVTIIK